MNIEDYSAEELRDLAARKEAQDLYAEHVGSDGDAPAHPASGYFMPVEVDGHTYRVDMRRMRSREFVRRLTDVQAKGGDATAADQLAVFDYLFEPNSDEIERVVEREMGYVDFQRYYDICTRLFEGANAKNL